MMENRRVELKKEIAKYYQHLFTLIPKAPNIILHSGRMCTKSVFIAMGNLWRMMKISNLDVCVIAYEYNSIKEKNFLDYMDAIRFLGIPEKCVESKCNDNGETGIKLHTPNSTNQVHFRHAKGKSESLKGYHPSKGNKGGNINFFELTQFNGGDNTEITNTIATFIRDAQGTIRWDIIKPYCEKNGLKLPKNEDELYEQPGFRENGSEFFDSLFCVTYEFNTPSGEASGILDFVDKMKPRVDTYYQFNNYLDMTEEEKFKFLGPISLRSIQNTKDTDLITYNHVFLGKKPYNGDVVYPMLNHSIHFGKHENFNPDLLVIGVDVGRSDATVCCLNAYEFHEKDLRVALGMEVWYHSNRKAEYTKNGFPQKYRAFDAIDYTNMIKEFCDKIHAAFPSKYIYFQMDYANEGHSFYDLLFRDNLPNGLYINKSGQKVSIPTRLDTFQTMFTTPGIVKIYDPALFKAFRNQIYGAKDAKTGERKPLDDPTNRTLDMDRQDACCYGVLKEMHRDIVDRIRKTKGKGDPRVYQEI